MFLILFLHCREYNIYRLLKTLRYLILQYLLMTWPHFNVLKPMIQQALERKVAYRSEGLELVRKKMVRLNGLVHSKQGFDWLRGNMIGPDY